MKIHQLTAAQIDRATATDTPLTALYDIAFPEWDGESVIIPQYFKVSKVTWNYIIDLLEEKYDTAGLFLWVNSGFSSNQTVPDWEVWHDHE